MTTTERKIGELKAVRDALLEESEIMRTDCHKEAKRIEQAIERLNTKQAEQTIDRDRLRWEIERLGLTESELAEALGITEGSFAQMLKPSQPTPRWAKAFLLGVHASRIANIRSLRALRESVAQDLIE